jgi:hypothetical protein
MPKDPRPPAAAGDPLAKPAAPPAGESATKDPVAKDPTLPPKGCIGTFRYWGPETRAEAITARTKRLSMVQSGKPGPPPNPDSIIARATQTEDGLRKGYPEKVPATVLGPGTRPGSVKIMLHLGEDADREQDNVALGDADTTGVFAG